MVLLQVVGGLLAEALMLLDAGLAPNSNMATKAIGYRQAMTWWQGLLGQLRPPTTAAAAVAQQQEGHLLSEQLKQRFQPEAVEAQPPSAAAEGRQTKRQKASVMQGEQAVAVAASEQGPAAQERQPDAQQSSCARTEGDPPTSAAVVAAAAPPPSAADPVQQQQALQVPRVTPAQVLQLAADVATASRNLVKSQYTYFRDEPLFAWVEASDPEAAFQEVAAALGTPHHAGNCGDHDSGRLDAAAQKALRLYQPRWQLLKQGEVMEGVLGWVHQVLDQRASATAGAAATAGAKAPTADDTAPAAPASVGQSQHT